MSDNADPLPHAMQTLQKKVQEIDGSKPLHTEQIQTDAA